jgi:hypothetical protein
VESSCELGNEPSGSIKCWDYRVAAQLVASRAVLSSTELVISETIEGHNSHFYSVRTCSIKGAYSSAVVMALCCKPEGCGFETR